MSCLPAAMYSVCKSDISETSKSEPVYAVLGTISLELTNNEFERNLLHLYCTLQGPVLNYEC